MISNCLLAAWKAYVSKDDLWIACRKSSWSKFKDITVKSLPLSVLVFFFKLVGNVLLWISLITWVVGHTLRFGTWPHFAFCEKIGADCLEVVPEDKDKEYHVIPPMIFNAKIQKVDK